jgi:hypothetical protein
MYRRGNLRIYAHVAWGGAGNAGALWAFPMGGQSAGDCQCDYWRPQMDGYARLWVPASQIGSVTVIDANGNRVARVGRYGNVNDADPAFGNIHFAYVRTVAANDSWMWAVDSGNQRVLKAALAYPAGESVPIP